ncbi:MAG: citrate (Si)-synthase [Anaerolineales bacterium]|nr:citrate (Si)-synthase [Anaerolineales bacterium]
MFLYDNLKAQIPLWRERAAKLVREHADMVIDTVKMSQIYGGMRGVRSLVTDISFVDPAEGIRLRGLTVPQTIDFLPTSDQGTMPYVGGLYYLLLTGEIPSKEQAEEIELEWCKRSDIPPYIFQMLRDIPRDTHPMVMFSQAVLALQPYSAFYKRYHEGMSKEDYWEPALEDALDLTAKLPGIAAYIYNLKYKEGQEPDCANLDYGANFAAMIGVEDQIGYADLARLYFIIHSDHELGNASAHTTHLVSSTLSDIFYAYSAGLNALAGPLHGLANQKGLDWLLGVRDKFGGVPTRNQLREYTWETLNAGQVIPGYGHAVLRVPDPRFMVQLRYAREHFPEDPLIKIAELVFDVVPDVLIEQGKAKNPAPNVDAISGALQYHYGIEGFDFYTVLFGVGRALGVTANYVWARALNQPLERPKSLTTPMLECLVNDTDCKE